MGYQPKTSRDGIAKILCTPIRIEIGTTWLWLLHILGKCYAVGGIRFQATWHNIPKRKTLIQYPPSTLVPIKYGRRKGLSLCLSSSDMALTADDRTNAYQRARRVLRKRWSILSPAKVCYKQLQSVLHDLNISTSSRLVRHQSSIHFWGAKRWEDSRQSVPGTQYALIITFSVPCITKNV